MNITNVAPYLQDIAKYNLGDPSTFHYLNQTNDYKVSTIDDAREYLETRNGMDVVGISREEQVFIANGLICTLWKPNVHKNSDMFLNAIDDI